VSATFPLAQSYWPSSETEPLLELSLGELLTRHADEVPSRVALVEAGPDPARRRKWSYSELLQAARRVAGALLERFEPGQRIAVWAPNCAEWVLLQHGASLAGMVLVTVNPAYVADEVRHVLSASRAVGIVHADRYRSTDMTQVVRQVHRDLPHLRHAWALSEWDEFIKGGQADASLPLVRPGDMIQIQFTSGTTGKPKGACLHHRGVINAARFAARRARFPEGGVWATAMPLFHVGGCAGSEIGALSSKGTFVLQSAFDAGSMLEIIESEHVNHLHAVPTMVTRLLDHPSRPTRDLSSLRTLMSGGSPVPPSLVDRARDELGCRFTITFGQTELNGVVSQTCPEDEPERQSRSIGRPAPWVELKIADPSSGAVRALGQTGEIWARGYQVMLGYFDLPTGSDGAITSDGWLRTGDLASMDDAGYLHIAGRLKDCIIRGGENIYPREIEEVLLRHEGIHQASVVGVPDPQWGEVVAAVLQCKPGSAPATIDLHHHCRQHLAAYKTPVMWFYVEQYPTTTSGKIQKFVLRDRISKGLMTPEPFEKPVASRFA
jgi:fatty-acyl-CoA synthase